LYLLTDKWHSVAYKVLNHRAAPGRSTLAAMRAMGIDVSVALGLDGQVALKLSAVSVWGSMAPRGGSGWGDRMIPATRWFQHLLLGEGEQERADGQA
jgi:hypothetical protein